MKKTNLLLLAFFLALSMGVYAAGPEVKASILRYEPAPAEQGNTMDVWLQLSNAGTAADKVAVKFVPEYPFSIPDTQKGEIDVGRIASTESKVVKFTIYVDGNAPNGDRSIKFQYKFSANDDWIQLEAPITLQTQNAILIVDDYAVKPSPVVPGQSVFVEMKLRNAGKIGVKNLDVSIDLADGKFSAIGSGAKKRIESIASGETEVVKFQLASDTSTEVKVYSIPVTLGYQDDRNKNYNDTAKISLVVNAQPELSLTVDSTKFDTKTAPGTVSLKIVNKGIVNLKYVTVKLLGGDYDLLSSTNEAYVGNLDSDDFETVDFQIKPNTDKPTLGVQIDFKDPYNVDFSKQYTLPVRIITADDLGKGKSWTSTIVVLVLVIAGIVYYFRRKKKR